MSHNKAEAYLSISKSLWAQYRVSLHAPVCPKADPRKLEARDRQRHEAWRAKTPGHNHWRADAELCALRCGLCGEVALRVAERELWAAGCGVRARVAFGTLELLNSRGLTYSKHKRLVQLFRDAWNTHVAGTPITSPGGGR